MILNRYAYINAYKVTIENKKKVKNKPFKLILKDSSIDITLAQLSPVVSEHVIIHRLADYRKENMPLELPETETMMDKLIFDRSSLAKQVPDLSNH